MESVGAKVQVRTEGAWSRTSGPLHHLHSIREPRGRWSLQDSRVLGEKPEYGNQSTPFARLGNISIIFSPLFKLNGSFLIMKGLYGSISWNS